jgi:hypothetical protein
MDYRVFLHTSSKSDDAYIPSCPPKHRAICCLYRCELVRTPSSKLVQKWVNTVFSRARQTLTYDLYDLVEPVASRPPLFWSELGPEASLLVPRLFSSFINMSSVLCPTIAFESSGDEYTLGFTYYRPSRTSDWSSRVAKQGLLLINQPCMDPLVPPEVHD